MAFSNRAGSPSDLLARPSSPETNDGRCDTCRRQGTIRNGSNWCSKCSERYCDTCASYHLRDTMGGPHYGGKTLTSDAKLQLKHFKPVKCGTHFIEGVTLFCKRCQRSYCAFCAIGEHCKCGGSSVVISSQSDIKKLKGKQVCDRNFSKSVSEFRYSTRSVSEPNLKERIEKRVKQREPTLFSLSRSNSKPNKLPVPRCRMNPVARLQTSAQSDKDWINSMAMLSNGSLLIVQLYRADLKHITPSGIILSSCSFYADPWAVTCIDDKMAAVTLPERKHIQLVKIKFDGLQPSRRIVTKHKCLGICATETRLIATCWLGCVHVISLTGDEFICINKNMRGERIFRNPEYIVSNPDKTVVYITDFKKHTLTALKIEGNRINRTPLFVFSDPQMRGPKGVAVDGQGFIYISGMTSKNIFKLTPEGTKVQTFRRKKDAELYEDICVSQAGDLVYISVFEGDVLVYTLTSTDLCQACEIFTRLN